MDYIDATEDELLTALESALCSKDNRDGALTREEIQHQTGWGAKRVMRALHALNNDGRLTVIYVQRVGIDGKPRPKPGYRICENDDKEENQDTQS